MSVVDYESSPIRVLFAKGGLDAHERGIHVVVLGLRDLGFEVIYLGLRRSPEEIVRAACDEDVDVVGISTLSGSHKTFVGRTLQLLREADCSCAFVVGGLIPPEDQSALVNEGVDIVFPPGTLVRDIAERLRELVRQKRIREQ